MLIGEMILISCVNKDIVKWSDASAISYSMLIADVAVLSLY